MTDNADLVGALLHSLKRCAFLLNSSRLVMADKEARDIAGEAVTEARRAIAWAEDRIQPEGV